MNTLSEKISKKGYITNGSKIPVILQINAIEAVKEWLREVGNGIDTQYDNAQSDYMRKMCEGAKYTIRGLIKDLE